MLKLNSGMKKRLIAVVALVLAVGMLLSLTGCSVVNKLTAKYLDSGPKYFALVEQKDVAQFCETFEIYYQDYLKDTFSRNNQFKIKASLDLGEELKQSLRESVNDQIEVDWLSQTDFDVTLQARDMKTSAEILFGIGGQHVLNISAFFDAESGSLLLGLREITDDLMRLNAENSNGDAIFAGKQLAAQTLPDASAVTNLMIKYHGILIEKIEDIEKSSEEVTVDDLTQTLTVLKGTLTEAAATSAALEILNDMKVNPDVKAIVENLQVLLGDETESGTDAYERFLAEVDESIAQLEESEPDAENAVILYDYVNSDDKIVGRKIMDGEETVLSYITVEENGQFVSKTDLSEEYSITESGTKKGDLVTSDRYYVENDVTVLKISFADFDTEAFKKGTLSGKIRFYPNEETLEDAASDEFGDYAALLDVACELDIQGDQSAGTFNLTVFNGDAALFALRDASYALAEAGEVTEPDGKVITIDSLDALEELAAGLHLQPLVDNLRNTPIPQEYVDAIQEIADQMQG